MGNAFSTNNQQTEINNIKKDADDLRRDVNNLRRDVDDLKTDFQDRAQRIERQIEQVLNILNPQMGERPPTPYRQQYFQRQSSPNDQITQNQLQTQSIQEIQMTSQETPDNDRESNSISSQEQRGIINEQAAQVTRSGTSNIYQVNNTRQQNVAHTEPGSSSQNPQTGPS